MKKYRIQFSVCTALAFMLLVTAACGNSGNNANVAPAPTGSANEAPVAGDGIEEAVKLSVVTSFYPLYYFVTEIGGEHVEAVNLIAAGVEPHDWTPRSRDLSVASGAQLFLYHGAGLETWVDDFLKGLSQDSELVSKEMSYGIALISGDTAAHSHDDDGHSHDEHSHDDGHSHDEHSHDGHSHAEDAHSHDDGHSHDGHSHAEDAHSHDEEEHEDEHSAGDNGHNHSHDTDPHTWVSPKSALVLAANVKESLLTADPVNAESYERNYEALKQKIVALDERYSSELANVTQRNLVVSHQAFGYLARDYGLNQMAIMGLSPDAEPRAQDILRIANFVKDNDVKYIFFEELVSDQLAVMLANEAKVDTMVLNPLEGLTKEQEKAGETYLSLMERNLQNLLQALQ